MMICKISYTGECGALEDSGPKCLLPSQWVLLILELSPAPWFARFSRRFGKNYYFFFFPQAIRRKKWTGFRQLHPYSFSVLFCGFNLWDSLTENLIYSFYTSFFFLSFLSFPGSLLSCTFETSSDAANFISSG